MPLPRTSTLGRDYVWLLNQLAFAPPATLVTTVRVGNEHKSAVRAMAGWLIAIVRCQLFPAQARIWTGDGAAPRRW